MCVATLIHKSCGESAGIDQGRQGRELGFDAGRLLTVKVVNEGQPEVWVTNVYNHTAREGVEQQRLLDTTTERVEQSDRKGYMHIVGGDWNAGFFPQERRGYSEAGTVVQQADERFRNFATRNTVTGDGGRGG